MMMMCHRWSKFCCFFLSWFLEKVVGRSIITVFSLNGWTIVDFLHSPLVQVVGTIGYAAPEYLESGRLTSKSDVWSFGVVLYELITGRRSLDRNLPRSEQKLLRWVKPYAADPKKFHLIVDPRLGGEYCTKSARALAALADRCLQRQPKSRPRMSEVVEILSGIIEASGVDLSVAPGGGRAAAAAAEPSTQRRAYSVGESTLHRARSSTPFLYRGWWSMGLFDACRPAHWVNSGGRLRFISFFF